MNNGILGNLFGGAMGSSVSGSLGSQISPYQQSIANNGMIGQQQANMQAYQQMYASSARSQWMIAGKPMTITEFAEELFGDTPQRTMFLLKYSGEEKK